MGCPLTKGSCGSLNSRGVISVCELLRDEVVSEANVFARVRKGNEELEGPVGEGSGRDPGKLVFSGCRNCGLPTVGMDKPRGRSLSLSEDGRFVKRYSSSGGTWSAGGIGRPLAAAISWCSAQFSEKSFRPFQYGASRRSI